MALYNSPSCILLIPPCLFLSLSLGCHALQLKKKNTIRLHLTSPLLNFVHVLLWMTRVLKASVQVITFFLSNFFLSVWLFVWEYFFIASNTTSITLLFFFFFFFFWHLSSPYDVSGEVAGEGMMCKVWGQGECRGQSEVPLAEWRLKRDVTRKLMLSLA